MKHKDSTEEQNIEDMTLAPKNRGNKVYTKVKPSESNQDGTDDQNWWETRQKQKVKLDRRREEYFKIKRKH